MVSNIVPVIKKNGQVVICINFRNLNLATHKDEYVMPIADMLVDTTFNTAKVAKVYNKVKKKSFVEGDLVWKTILSIGSKDPQYGK